MGGGGEAEKSSKTEMRCAPHCLQLEQQTLLTRLKILRHKSHGWSAAACASLSLALVDRGGIRGLRPSLNWQSSGSLISIPPVPSHGPLVPPPHVQDQPHPAALCLSSSLSVRGKSCISQPHLQTGRRCSWGDGHTSCQTLQDQRERS